MQYVIISLIVCLIILGSIFVYKYTKDKNKISQLENELQSFKSIAQNSSEYNTKLQEQQINETSKIKEDFANEKLQIENDLNIIKSNTEIEKQLIIEDLNKYIRLQDAVNQEYITREERKQNESFYHITLDSYDEHDIELIRTLSIQLYKPEKILKFIYENYYRDKLFAKFKQILIQKDAFEKGGIYKITNIKDDKMYIGQAKDINERWRQHVGNSLKNKNEEKQCTTLYNAIKNEGIENFKFEVLEVIENPNELNDKEKFWIDYFKSNIIGYNIKAGG